MKIRLLVQKNSIYVAVALTICLIGFSSLLTFLGKHEALSFNETKEQVERASQKINNMFKHMSNMTKGVRGVYDYAGRKIPETLLRCG